MTDRPTGTTIRLERLTRELERAHREADLAILAEPTNVRRPDDGLRHYLAAHERTQLLHLTMRAMQRDSTPSLWTSARLHVVARELDNAQHETERATRPEPNTTATATSNLQRYLAANARAKAIRRLIRAIERDAAGTASLAEDAKKDGDNCPADTCSNTTSTQPAATQNT